MSPCHKASAKAEGVITQNKTTVIRSRFIGLTSIVENSCDHGTLFRAPLQVTLHPDLAPKLLSVTLTVIVSVASVMVAGVTIAPVNEENQIKVSPRGLKTVPL